MPDITELSDEELKKLYEASTPSPGIAEGTARAISQGAIGVPNQPKDTAFANDHSVYSTGGGMLGRAADILLPILGGRMAGRALANRIKPSVDVDQAAAFARNAAIRNNRANRIRDPDERANNITIADRAGVRAAEAQNKSADRWKTGLQFGGGVAGGAIGGAGGAYLHGEDPQSGALIGGATGVAPAIPSQWLKYPLAAGVATGLGYTAKMLPDPLNKVADDAKLGVVLRTIENWGKKK